MLVKKIDKFVLKVMKNERIEARSVFYVLNRLDVEEVVEICDFHLEFHGEGEFLFRNISFFQLKLQLTLECFNYIITFANHFPSNFHKNSNQFFSSFLSTQNASKLGQFTIEQHRINLHHD